MVRRQKHVNSTCQHACSTHAKALTLMDIPLANVIRDVTGAETGMRIIRAIASGNGTRTY